MIENFRGKKPVLRPGAAIHETAYVSGDVTLGRESSVFPMAAVRGDIAPIVIGDCSNVQDNATLHGSPGGRTVLGNYVTVGHNAIVHGATVGDNTIIGMGAIVLDDAVIGKNCIIGAGCVIPGGKVIPDNSVAVGNPYRILKTLTDEQAQSNRDNALEYVELSREFVRAKGRKSVSKGAE